MEPTFKNENPVTEGWVRETISRSHPRLILTPGLLRDLNKAIASQGSGARLYKLLKEDADLLLDKSPLERQLEGRRLLRVSRKAVGRTLALALVYKLEQDPAYLERLELELRALCAFSDWNPAHFLDVAEMAVAVALPLDWCHDELSEETKQAARDSILRKALIPGLAVNGDNWWFDATHNWNPVCHGGLAIAALAVFEEHPEIAAKVIRRSVEKAPLAFSQYAPDGAYREGPSYWKYATDYLTLTLSAYRSALNTEFGLDKGPGFKQSALFSLMTGGPSGDFYNYFDAGTGGYRDLDHIGLLAWFAARGQPGLSSLVLQHLASAIETEKRPVDKFATVYLLNLLRMPEAASGDEIPRSWVAGGPAPLGVLAPESDAGLYLAAKGGSASDNHGDMDAGSFILEWRKIRWAVDLGKQDYTMLESVIGVGALWNNKQSSPRWSLLAKNNFGHSTLTVNGNLLQAAGRALLESSDLDSELPSFSFDLTPLYGDTVGSVRRSFKRLNENALLITDEILANEETRSLVWQFITRAEVEITQGGAILEQQGEKLQLAVVSPEEFQIRVIPLDPPPLAHDITITGLKRIEILVTPDRPGGKVQHIAVRLAGETGNFPPD